MKINSIRYIVISLIASFAVVGAVNAVGVFYYDAAANQFVLDGSLKISDPGSFKLLLRELNSTDDSHLYVNGRKDVQIRLDADNTDTSKFKVNNGINSEVFSVDEAGLINSGRNTAIGGSATINGNTSVTGALTTTGNTTIGGLLTTNGLSNTGTINSTGMITSGGITSTAGASITGGVTIGNDIGIGRSTSDDAIFYFYKNSSNYAGYILLDNAGTGNLILRAGTAAENPKSVEIRGNLSVTGTITGTYGGATGTGGYACDSSQQVSAFTNLELKMWNGGGTEPSCSTGYTSGTALKDYANCTAAGCFSINAKICYISNTLCKP